MLSIVQVLLFLTMTKKKKTSLYTHSNSAPNLKFMYLLVMHKESVPISK